MPLGYTDTRADDLADCFNFNQSPIAFRTIQEPFAGTASFANGPPDND